jgi:hypothetical protein
MGVGRAVQGSSDRSGVVFDPENRQRRGKRVDRLGETALVAKGIAEGPQANGPVMPIVLAVTDRRCFGQEGNGLVVPAQFPVQRAEAAKDPGSGRYVRAVAGGVESELAATRRPPGPATPACRSHLTRSGRSRAMHLVQAGVDLIYIRDLLGHADVSTTEISAVTPRARGERPGP